MTARTGRSLALGVISVAILVIFIQVGMVWRHGAIGQPEASIDGVSFDKIAEGFRSPVAITHAGDDSNRLFIVEQAGLVRVIKDGKIEATAFLDVRERVTAGGEMGFLSIAFHPKYPDSPQVYANYTTKSGRNRWTHIVEYTLDSTSGRLDPDSERELLRIAQPWGNHNGGQILFGPDGYLYIGMGDGGAANDPKNSGQDPESLLGKVLRIDVNVKDEGLAYGIPKDNPFVDHERIRPEVWCLGMRNPWRISFDRETGVCYTGDVGQNKWEEIDVLESGKNYGWRVMEGHIRTPGIKDKPDPDLGQHVPPIAVYPRSHGVSVTGGYVYRGKSVGALQGMYLYADYGSGRIWGLTYDAESAKATEPVELFKTPMSISTFGEDEAGELYFADHNRGRIYRFTGE